MASAVISLDPVTAAAHVEPAEGGPIAHAQGATFPTPDGLPYEQIGPYRVLRILGSGGMGTVYEGLQPGIERRVAIKILHPDLAARPDAQMRLYREARAVNRVGHPGLVEISEVERLADGGLYLVMEFLRGETLAERLQRGGGILPVRDAIQIAAALADILSAAHQHGVIHRDIKPGNVMLVPDSQVPSGERVKLIDFGIAKLASASTTSQDRTPQDTVLGTPDYMSPEQCAGEASLDGKSDLYALGALLFHMVAGRPPFVAATPRLVMAKHQLETPAGLCGLRPEVPDELAALVAQLLAKTPAQRPSAGELLQILRGLSGVAASASLPTASAAAPRLHLPKVQATLGEASPLRPQRSARWAAWLALSMAFVLLGIFGLWWQRSSREPQVRSSPTNPPGPQPTVQVPANPPAATDSRLAVPLRQAESPRPVAPAKAGLPGQPAPAHKPARRLPAHRPPPRPSKRQDEQDYDPFKFPPAL